MGAARVGSPRTLVNPMIRMLVTYSYRRIVMNPSIPFLALSLAAAPAHMGATIAAPNIPSTRPSPSTSQSTRSPTWRRGEQLAGAIVLPFGLFALGVVIPTIFSHRRTLDRADRLHAELTARPCTDHDRDSMRSLLLTARRQEGAMIALGVAAGVLLTVGAVLLVRGRRPPPRVQLGLDLRSHFAGLALSGRF